MCGRPDTAYDRPLARSDAWLHVVLIARHCSHVGGCRSLRRGDLRRRRLAGPSSIPHPRRHLEHVDSGSSSPTSLRRRSRSPNLASIARNLAGPAAKRISAAGICKARQTFDSERSPLPCACGHRSEDTALSSAAHRRPSGGMKFAAVPARQHADADLLHQFPKRCRRHGVLQSCVLEQFAGNSLTARSFALGITWTG